MRLNRANGSLNQLTCVLELGDLQSAEEDDLCSLALKLAAAELERDDGVTVDCDLRNFCLQKVGELYFLFHFEGR